MIEIIVILLANQVELGYNKRNINLILGEKANVEKKRVKTKSEKSCP